MIPILPVLLLALLLLFPGISVQGAADGLLLWYRTVLPALLPFLICTQMIAGCGGLSLLMRPFAPVFRLLFGLSPDGSYVLLCGLLCGYPLGARLCAQFLQEKRISRAEAQYLLSICNHPSPMFVSGYLRQILPLPVPSGLLFLCLYGPVLPLSVLSRRIYHENPAARRQASQDAKYGSRSFTERDTPGSGRMQAYRVSPKNESGLGALPTEPTAGQRSFRDILLSSCETMVLIGCCIMLFSILSRWLLLLPGIPGQTQALLCGLAEITTGSRRICQVFPGKAALLPVLVSVAFGGLSGLVQTAAVIRPEAADSQEQTGDPDENSRRLQQTNTQIHHGYENAGLSARHYVLWKLLHAALTAGCCCLLLIITR